MFHFPEFSIFTIYLEHAAKPMLRNKSEKGLFECDTADSDSKNIYSNTTTDLLLSILM